MLGTLLKYFDIFWLAMEHNLFKYLTERAAELRKEAFRLSKLKQPENYQQRIGWLYAMADKYEQHAYEQNL